MAGKQTAPRKVKGDDAKADALTEGAKGADATRKSAQSTTTRVVGEGVSAVWVHLADLKPHPRNPRIHGAEKLLLARTIIRTRWGAPVIVQASTMRIIGGHGRREAGLEIMAGIEVDGVLRGGADYLLDPDAPGPGMVPCRIVACSDAEADAMTLSDNSRRLQGRDDAALLVAMASESFMRDAPTMVDMGFGGTDLDALVQRAGDEVLAGASGVFGSDGGGVDGNVERPDVIGGPAAVDGVDPEVEEPAPDAPVFSKAGEVYELGPHRLVCGDSRDPAAWALLLGDAKLQAAWTDPPYGVAYVGKTADALTIDNDALDESGLRAFLDAVFVLALANCAPGSSWYVAAAPGPLHLQFALSLHALGVWRQTLTWVKQQFVLGHSDYHYRHEPIFYGWTPGAAHYFVDDRTQDSVLTFDRPSRNAEHPTMKPVDLVQRCVENSSKPGWLVGDPFGGSGTTLIACAKTGRIARLIELAPRYCDVIRRRWTKFARSANVDPGPGALD